MVLCIFLFIILFIVLLVMMEKTECYDGQPPSCIITMTTYMGFEDRSRHIHTILRPLVQTGQEVIVINEWDENYLSYIDLMKKHYPQIRFIQKSREDQGQARSLNILIRDHLLHCPHKYWIHWEDTWVCSRPLLPDVITMMEKNPQVAQLQLTDDWKKMQHSTPLPDITILHPPHKDDKSIYERDQLEIGTWPLFSLRPSINRLSFFQRHANDFYFLEDPYLWPLRFEWEFGRIFLRNKGVKAITNKPYARRVGGHKSTYTDLLNGGWKYSRV